MAAPSLEPLSINQPLGTPAAEWAKETVQAIDPNAATGLVTDASGNPTADHNKSALDGEPGHGINANKTGTLLEAQKTIPQATYSIPAAELKPPTAGADKALPVTPLETPFVEKPQDATIETNEHHHPEKPQTEPSPKTYTDAHGNPTTDPNASALAGTPGEVVPQHNVASGGNTASTPGVQLPGGWIRGPESRQHSMIIPETSLYEDVSTALGTVGQAAFSVLPASVVGSLSNNPEQGGANPDATHPQPGDGVTAGPSPPARSSSPGILSRAQGLFNGLLARPASPAPGLPVPDAPTTIGDAARVGGGAIAQNANALGDNIAANQDLGGHDPKGVLADEQTRLEKEGSGRSISPSGADTAARFLNADIPTPDPNQPPKDPGFSGSVFPVLADEGNKDKKGMKLGSSLSPDLDVQEAARRSNQDFSVPIPSPSPAPKSPQSPSSVDSSDRPQPKVTKVSDSGVVGKLLDAKDTVSVPFAGSRAPINSSSGNPEGIRTAANPHTAHTGLPPPRDEARTDHIGGTAVLPRPSHEAEGNPSPSEPNGAHIPGISVRGQGQGKVYAHEEGAITDGVPAEKSAPGSPSKGVSRLWSRSRRSVDEGTTSSKTKSRFSENDPSTSSETTSAPGSPTSSRFKVPLKDKIKGEIKIISGKMSKNEAKVEQGIALKTGHAHPEDAKH